MTPAELALKDLVAACERMRDRAGFFQKRHVHQVTTTEWQSFCAQLKFAKRALGEVAPTPIVYDEAKLS